MYKKLISISALSLLSACGGSSGGGDPIASTGVFIDSPVVNIGYKTETLEGVTNSKGEYQYLEGETVTFFIGTLELPAVTATGTVTPLDLAQTTDSNNPKVVNMIRLLQTLDQDGNPDNGLTITEEAKGWAVQVDFDVSVTEFEVSQVVSDIISNAGQDAPVTELVPKEDAIAHFQESLNKLTKEPVFTSDNKFNTNGLVGTTLYNIYTNEDDGGKEAETITFNADGSFAHADGLNAANTPSGNWSIVNGDLLLDSSEEEDYLIHVHGSDESLGAKLTCWSETSTPCSDDTEWLFESKEKAQEFFAQGSSSSFDLEKGFTAEWLNGKTLYNVFREDDGNGGVYWKTDVLIFTNSGVSMFALSDPDNVYDFSYTITDEGYLAIDVTDEMSYTKVISDEGDYFIAAWSDVFSEVDSATSGDDYYFYSAESAAAFIAQQ